MLNGTVTFEGDPAYSERGFVYNTESTPTLESCLGHPKVQGTSNADYSYRLTGLTLGTTYYVRAYVVNSFGTYYSSNEISFTTKKTDLHVTVEEPTDIDGPTGSVLLHGTIIGEGIAYTERGFVYGATTTLDIEKDIKVVVTGTGTGAYSIKVADLPPKKFYLKAYAISNGEVVYSESSVLLSCTLPLVITEEPMNVDISKGTATLRGTIIYAGYPAYFERGFVYGTIPEPTINDNKIVANGSVVVTPFSIYTEELPKGKTFYIRAYATNELGTTYGKVIEIATEWIEYPVLGIAVQKMDIGYGYRSSMSNFCWNSVLGGYKDWRLPSIDELEKLYVNNLIDGFDTTKKYWSASTYGSNPTHYYIMNFSNGNRETVHSLYETKNTARCVRTLK